MTTDERPDAHPAAAETSARDEQMFPHLTAEQIARLAPFARERRFASGELVFDQGAEGIPFFVVVEGAIAILQPDGGAEEVVVVHEAGQFTGDVDMLSQRRRTVVRGRAQGATRALEIDRDRLRSLVQTDAELSEIFLRAFILRRVELVARGQGGLALVGSRHSAGTLRLQEFLTRNGRPYTYLDVDLDPPVRELLDHFHLGAGDVPVVICRGERVLKQPTVEEVAECLGLNAVDSSALRDLVVVGAGPAGLSTAVYAASEGLDVLVLEAYAPGGQAGSSSKIENYLGFPTGISGLELAGRAFVQAEKFGAEVSVARTAVRLACAGRRFRLELAGGDAVEARSVVIASGAEYRRPDLADLARFEGAGVYYGATKVEARLCSGEEVIVVGGGNSAGQAAVFLAGEARRVHMLVRGSGLAESMSRYLIRRIEETPNIELRTRTRIVALDGESQLERVTWLDAAGGDGTTAEVRHVFMMTGARPNTGWLAGCVAVDDKGFVKTGADLGAEELRAAGWPLARRPFLFETSRPGIFAVGDVRAGSVKRVAAAVGEGSVCVQLVHRVLAE
ncbi:MAG TPA: FAD-dependent oxidoreductase [Thermoanaerobaculia bacterium]|nr:FAD-dependent oxidoreductase [Thermoanaerobaculia bacterium]